MLIAFVYYLLYRRARNLRDREHEFVSTVTHELRTPVSAVSAVADNLAEGIVSDPERVREYGRAILDHGRRLRDLIDQVLLYAGLSGTAKRPPLEPIDLDKLARTVASQIPSLPRDRVIIHVQPKLRSTSGDSVAIETIIRNLLSNAAKHTDVSATVTISFYRETQRTRSWLVIRVSDTGPGIPKSELGRVLEPFYRGEQSRTRQTPGSGLGLSLVNRVVRTYRGRLSIDSAVGRGTIVTVRLPLETDGSDEG
jgi:signal transduction histidine kinase